MITRIAANDICINQVATIHYIPTTTISILNPLSNNAFPLYSNNDALLLLLCTSSLLPFSKKGRELVAQQYQQYVHPLS
eukprot:UN01968